MKTRIAVAVSVIAILVAAVSYGQTQSTMGRVTIPFKYMVGKHELPAGTYEFLKAQGKEFALQLRGLDNNANVFVNILERLAETHPTEQHNARVVFDTVGDRKVLSELWPAGNGDGYLLGINKGEQKHEIVEGK